MANRWCLATVSLSRCPPCGLTPDRSIVKDPQDPGASSANSTGSEPVTQRSPRMRNREHQLSAISIQLAGVAPERSLSDLFCTWRQSIQEMRVTLLRVRYAPITMVDLEILNLPQASSDKDSESPERVCIADLSKTTLLPAIEGT